MQKSSALSFKDLKQRISIEQVLRHYNLFDGLQLKGKSHRGPCPFCEAADGHPFSVSLEKSCYQCFACRISGNILDFVAKWEGVSIREAAQVLAQNFAEEKEPRAAAKIAESESPQAREADLPPAGKAEERAAQTSAADILQGESCSRNEPLSFALKNIEPGHLAYRAVTPNGPPCLLD